MLIGLTADTDRFRTRIVSCGFAGGNKKRGGVREKKFKTILKNFYFYPIL